MSTWGNCVRLHASLERVEEPCRQRGVRQQVLEAAMLLVALQEIFRLTVAPSGQTAALSD